jgi:hypothetical protein
VKSSQTAERSHPRLALAALSGDDADETTPALSARKRWLLAHLFRADLRIHPT